MRRLCPGSRWGWSNSVPRGWSPAAHPSSLAQRQRQKAWGWLSSLCLKMTALPCLLPLSSFWALALDPAKNHGNAVPLDRGLISLSLSQVSEPSTGQFRDLIFFHPTPFKYFLTTQSFKGDRNKAGPSAQAPHPLNYVFPKTFCVMPLPLASWNWLWSPWVLTQKPGWPFRVSALSHPQWALRSGAGLQLNVPPVVQRERGAGQKTSGCFHWKNNLQATYKPRNTKEGLFTFKSSE